MLQNLRLTMAWVHTWFGLVLGFVLLAAFFFGTLTVVARDIDRWAIPESRFAPEPLPSVDRVLLPIFEDMQPGAEERERLRRRSSGPLPERFEVVSYWQVFRTGRDSLIGLYAGFEVPGAAGPDDLIFADRIVDPRSGAALPDDTLPIGMGFFYPLHFDLTLEWRQLGVWVVGLAALAMLAVLVSGVVIHQRLFRDLFTVRVDRGAPRGILDVHNLAGVAALPFHFFFAFSGLVIFAEIYFPIAAGQLAPLHALHDRREAAATGVAPHRAGVAAPLASVDAMIAEAQRRWAARGIPGEPGSVVLVHVRDANGYVLVERAEGDQFAFVRSAIRFDAATGRVLHEEPPSTTTAKIAEFIAGLHLIPYQQWALRWLYLFGGLAGCVCIASGILYFAEKRKRRHGGEAAAVRVVDALAVTTVTGMLIATLAIFIANRLLSGTLPPGWPPRDVLQVDAFWAAWGLAMAHAFWRTRAAGAERRAPAWPEQCWAIAMLAASAVVLNWITTGDHLARTIGAGNWPVAGVDLALLVAAVTAAVIARRLARDVAAPVSRPMATAHA